MQLISLKAFNTFMSLHGIVMIVGILLGVGAMSNYLLPMMLGAKDMTFPRLNAFSFWLTVPAATILLSSLFLGGFDTGWTGYPPLEEALLRSREVTAAEDAAAAGPESSEGSGTPLAGSYRPGRWGSREVEFRSVRLIDARGRERHVFVPGETVTLALSVHAAAPVADFVFGLGLFAADGTSIYGTNTDIEGFLPRRIEGDAEVRLALEGLSLVEGTYLVDLAAHRRDGTPYDYLRGQHSFRVKSRTKDVGLYRPLHGCSFAGGAEIGPPEPRAELELGDEPGA